MRAHARECASCAELVASDGLVELLQAEAPPPAADLQLESALRSQLARETGLAARLRSLPTGRRLAAAFLFCSLLVALEGTVLARPDLHLIPGVVLGPIAILLGGVFGVGVWFTLRPLQRVALPDGLKLGLVLVGLAIPIALSFIQPETGHPAALKGSGDDWPKYAVLCLMHGLGLASVVWLALRALDRQRLRTRYGAFTASGAGALLATLGLQLHCPIPAAAHWLVGHAGVGFVLMGALLLGRGMLRRR